MRKWKDVTTYSQNCKDRTPRVWDLETDHLRVSVHRHIFNPGKWHISCHDLGLDGRELESPELSDAQQEGLRVVRHRLHEMLASLD